MNIQRWIARREPNWQRLGFILEKVAPLPPDLKVGSGKWKVGSGGYYFHARGV